MFNKDPTMAMKKNLAISLCIPFLSCFWNVQCLSEKYFIRVPTKNEIVLYPELLASAFKKKEIELFLQDKFPSSIN